MNTAPCGFLRFDDDGSIRMANATLLEILGYEAHQLLGTHIDQILPVPSRIFYQTHFFPLLKLHGKINEVYFSLKKSDGETVPMLVNAVRRQMDGKTGNDCVFIQMKQRGEYEDEILKAKRLAEEAVRTKDEFVAMVSHELRTPLSAIRGWCQMLIKGYVTEETMHKAIETIDRSSIALQRLIEDLMDFSRIISGKLRLKVERVDLRSVIDSSLDIVRLAAAAKDIRLEAVIEPDPPPVSGDPARLQQVIWNLLTNAIKFTPKHGLVRVELRRINSNVELSVSDTGEGISPEFLPYVFDRFRQADRPASKSKGGLGLGMAITRYLVELHGGSIGAESPGPEEGATFTVRLPVMIVENKVLVSGATIPVDLAAFDGLRIVIVEDDAEARRMLTTVLEHSGATVIACTDGEEAFQKAVELKPDLLISDIELQKGSGLELIKNIRATNDKTVSKIPAIALTANVGSTDRVRTLAAGFQMHVIKPVEPVELILAIANLIDRRPSRPLDES